MKPSDMTSQCRWLVGPSFLKTPEANWPQTSLPQVLEEDRDVLIQSNSLVEVKKPAIYELLERYLSWNVLKAKIVWLTRFKNLLIQVYSEEYTDLNKKKSVKVTSNIARLNPFVGDDGVIRVGSRLELAPLTYDAKFPPVLPKHHWVSQLLARHIHCDNGNIGQEHTLNLLRERFWSCKARSLVRKIINKCFVCRKGHASKLHQQMAPLPKCRVAAYEPLHLRRNRYARPTVNKARSVHAKEMGMHFLLYGNTCDTPGSYAFVGN